MATYLIGFVLSDFEYSSNELTRQEGETLHRISARSNTGKSTKHALEINEKVLKDLEKYLDFEFEFNKLDSIAITEKDTREFYVKFWITITEIRINSNCRWWNGNIHRRFDAI